MISNFIIYLMVAFMLLGAADRIAGNRLGLGSQFEEGIHAMGPMTLGMAGLMVSSRLIGQVITPTLGVFFSKMGADPCMAGGFLLSIDTGLYPLAHEMQPANPDIANFSAIFLGSMMGPVIAFSIPVGMGMLDKKDHPCLALGSMAGMICIPFACIFGGLLAGYAPIMLLKNIFPVILISLLLVLGLRLIPDKMMKGFSVFAKILQIFLTFFLALAILQELTPLHFMELSPLSEVWQVIGSIAIVLAGAYPFAAVISKVLKKPLRIIGAAIGADETAVSSMIASCANAVPAFTLMKNSSARGKVLAIAFNACAAFGLGDHLGFCAGVEPSLITAMVVAKIAGGIMSVLCAMALLKMSAFE